MNTEWEMEAATMERQMRRIAREIAMATNEHTRETLAMKYHEMNSRLVQLLADAAGEVED